MLVSLFNFILFSLQFIVRAMMLQCIVDKLQKDEEALQRMLLLSSSLHLQHHEMTSSVQELLAVVRGNLVSRKREMETLAQDSGHVDCQEGSASELLVSHYLYCRPVCLSEACPDIY